jgi:4-amino-4-deoxy-L-arabinose transferase-like glycosyltransferase
VAAGPVPHALAGGLGGVGTVDMVSRGRGTGAPVRAPADASSVAVAEHAGAGGYGHPGAPAPARLMSISVPGRVVGAVAVASAVLAVVLKHVLFTHLSIDNDEALYRLEAQTLLSGHLLPAAPHPAGSYAPWLAAVRDGHYVLKYTPILPGFLAASLFVTGGFSAALGLVAAGAVVVTYLLGVEVLGDRRTAAAAAALFAASPLVVVQSALLLPYLPVAVLLELAVYGLLRALRRARPGPLVGAGLATGLAADVRAYDTLLFLAPVLVWVVVTHGHRVWWVLRWVGLGLLPPAGILLASNQAATGSPFRLPFAYLESQDKLGFGVRRLYPTDRGRHFGLVQGLSGVGNHLFLLAGWGFGGAVLFILAAVAVCRRRVGGPGLALAAGAGAFLVGYLAFWGAWNAADVWGGVRYVGPFYVLPVLIPLVLLGARGLADLAAARPRTTVLALTAAVAASAVALAVALPADATFTTHDRGLAALLAGRPGRPLVLVDIDPPFLMHPSAMVANPPALDGRILYAVARGASDLDVVADHPSRQAYTLRITGTWNRTPDARSVAQLERLTRVDGKSVTFDVAARPPSGSSAARLAEDDGGVRRSYPLGPAGVSRLGMTLDAGGFQLSGTMGPPTVRATAPTGDHSVWLGLYATDRLSGKEHLVDQMMIAVRPAAGGSISVLAPAGTVGVVGTNAPPALDARLR